MVASAGKSGGRVVAGAGLAQLRHDVALVDGLGLVGDRVAVEAGAGPAQRGVLGLAGRGAALARGAPRASH